MLRVSSERSDVSMSIVGNVSLTQKQDDIAIAHFEAVLEQNRLSSSLVRGLETGARNPAE